ncbi:uncharacterized protein N7496_011286 [Penicillium cataractarum]|uniref:Rhodopsin domain-containing protein n=1 Tax=Penicillium cataractarum TaxID=2100454 RepID=A0A9W9RJV7_9EURO|nr:uncharacterized protein N7496_011286 [Penicillium cataractarum]KAJ5358873.1 hypothetical protein N7496_011286 [Penicillium cataractarum]
MSLSPRNSVYNAGPQLLRDVWGLTAVAILIIILRIIAKLRIGKFGADDILMVSALCLAVIGSIMVTLAIKLGFGQELSSINTSNVSKIIMHDYLTQTFGLAGGALGRISFIVFIIGLLVQKRSHRIILWILIGLQVIVNSIFIIILFVQCPGHASAIWAHSGKAKCWDLHVQAYYGYFQGAFNSATDLYLAVFSTCIFWNLNLKVRVKVGLVALLGMGIFAMIASIIKTVQTRVLATSDSEPTTATIDYDRWIYIETYLVIITASIPCIRSLLRPTNSRKISSSDTHELSSRYAISSMRSRTRRRDSSIDGKRIINVSEGDLSIDDEISRGYQHNVTPQLGESRESVVICV